MKLLNCGWVLWIEQREFYSVMCTCLEEPNEIAGDKGYTEKSMGDIHTVPSAGPVILQNTSLPQTYMLSLMSSIILWQQEAEKMRFNAKKIAK